jgi:hypothetical protein
MNLTGQIKAISTIMTRLFGDIHAFLCQSAYTKGLGGITAMHVLFKIVLPK